MILNEEATTLDSSLIVYAVRETMRKKDPLGADRYPHNVVVLIFSEIHSVQGTPAEIGYPLLTYEARSTKGYAEHFADVLQEKWAQYNGIPLLNGPSNTWMDYKPTKS